MSIESNKKPRRGRLAPRPEIWVLCDDGDHLSRGLELFYERAFVDSRLAVFFRGFSQEWLRIKQFSFLRSLISGDRSYMGNHPRRAHHWMAISDDLFTYREEMLSSALRDVGLPEVVVEHIRMLDETFRSAIVKEQTIAPGNTDTKHETAFERQYFEEMLICDLCAAQIPGGDAVVYHRRTGTVLCHKCVSDYVSASGSYPSLASL